MRNYNPYCLPPWLRTIRFYCKHISIPIFVFQLGRVIIIPTTGDFLFMVFLLGLMIAFQRDIL